MSTPGYTKGKQVQPGDDFLEKDEYQALKVDYFGIPAFPNDHHLEGLDIPRKNHYTKVVVYMFIQENK